MSGSQRSVLPVSKLEGRTALTKNKVQSCLQLLILNPDARPSKTSLLRKLSSGQASALSLAHPAHFKDIYVFLWYFLEDFVVLPVPRLTLTLNEIWSCARLSKPP